MKFEVYFIITAKKTCPYGAGLLLIIQQEVLLC